MRPNTVYTVSKLNEEDVKLVVIDTLIELGFNITLEQLALIGIRDVRENNHPLMKALIQRREIKEVIALP